MDVKNSSMWLAVMKKWNFYVNNNFGSGHLIHHIGKKIKKGPEQKVFWYPKISFVRPISHGKEFFKYVLYFQTFQQELQMAASNPILRIDV